METLTNPQQTIEELENLGTIKAVTSGMNGYPTPETGLAFIPNDRESLQIAMTMLNKNYADRFHSRDGWDMVEYKGQLFNLDQFAPKEEDFGDDYKVVKIDAKEEIPPFARSESFLGESNIEDAIEAWMGVCDTREEAVEAIQNRYKDLHDNMEVGYNLIHSDGWEDLLGDISFSHDTHHHMVGLFIDRDEEEGAEIWEAYYG